MIRISRKYFVSFLDGITPLEHLKIYRVVYIGSLVKITHLREALFSIMSRKYFVSFLEGITALVLLQIYRVVHVGCIFESLTWERLFSPLYNASHESGV